MLKPGRLYVQLSPLLYTVPFVANRLIPDRLGSVLLDVFQSRDRVMYDKFPALYRLCRGPARSTSDAWKRPGCASSPLEGTSATNLQFEESLTR
jgi:hypothetical protein